MEYTSGGKLPLRSIVCVCLVVGVVEVDVVVVDVMRNFFWFH